MVNARSASLPDFWESGSPPCRNTWRCCARTASSPRVGMARPSGTRSAAHRLGSCWKPCTMCIARRAARRSRGASEPAWRNATLRNINDGWIEREGPSGPQEAAMRALLLAAVLSGCAAQIAHSDASFTVTQTLVADEKAVFATVESINVVPARARIGGTVAELKVKEGDRVEAGQIVATIGDEKLVL